jgi:gamma-glutamylputrescine oxidase
LNRNSAITGIFFQIHFSKTMPTQQDFSFWESNAYSREWDICIIGSGITGISTGISLKERNPKLEILIVERWFISLGASTRNAGFSCFGSPSEILNDIKNMGEEMAVSLVSKRWNGLLKLKSRITELTRYETHGGYEMYHPDGFEIVVDQLNYLNQLLESVTAHKNIFRVVDVPEGIRGFSHAVFNPLEGQLHPALMMEDLKKKFLGLGGSIWSGYPVESIVDQGDHVKLVNHLAFPIIAKKVIVTTNAFASQLLPQLHVHGARNHVMVTTPVPGLPWKGCFHYDKGFYYFRNIDNRILIGGARNADLENENTDQFGFNPKIVATLQQFLFDHLAVRDHCKVEFQWSGIIGIGDIKMPIIKAISPRVFVGVRLSGMGIALASLIGEELTDLVLQQE